MKKDIAQNSIAARRRSRKGNGRALLPGKKKKTNSDADGEPLLGNQAKTFPKLDRTGAPDQAIAEEEKRKQEN